MRWLFLLGAALAAGCGGTAVIDAGGSGGAGSSSSSGAGATTSSSSSASSSSSGGGGCADHGECPPNSVCIFATGQCALVCGDFCDACTPG
ncbi:MAG: hypothetical protein KC731_41205, partial [Myxococcales bacterium]|nr:hypothetical protein [Myxococcales bacterium]